MSAVRSLRRISCSGVAQRVVDPAWADPLDPVSAAHEGGRWNPPGSFGVLYLNLGEDVARANVARLFAGLPYGPEDLDPDTAPMLVEVTLPEEDDVDAVTTDGLAQLGLPASYPLDAVGVTVPRSTCQPIGQMLWEVGELGVVCLSAAFGAESGRELAWFASPGRTRLAVKARRPFNNWFWR